VTETVTVDAPAEAVSPPAAPVAAPESAPPETPADDQQPAKPLSKREARQAMRDQRRADRAAAEKTAAQKAAEARPRGEDGKFLAESGEDEKVAVGDEPTAEQDTKPKPASERAEEQVKDEDKAAAKKAGDGIRVDIPKGHPISEMGLDAFNASSDLEAQAIQGLLNGTYARRKDVEQRDERIGKLESENRELRQKMVRIDASASAADKWKASPDGQAAIARYEQIHEEIGKEAADEYWIGVQTKFQKVVETENTARWQEVEAQEADQAGERWTEEAWQTTQQRLPPFLRDIPDLKNWFTEEVQLFDQRLLAGHYPNITTPEQMHAEFARLLASRLVREPTAANALRAAKEAESRAKSDRAREETQRRADQEKSIEQVKAGAVTDFKAQAAETRKQTPTHPLAGVPGATGDGRTVSPDADGPDLDSLSPHELKRTLKRGARTDARRRFSPR
jgi:hypothetical protein